MVCDRLGRNKIVRVGKSSGPVLSHLWARVHGILEPSHFWFRTSLPDCQCHVSFRRYSSWSLEVVEKANNCKTFLTPSFFRGTTPTVLRQTVSEIYCPPFGKVWLSSACWCPSAKPGNEVDNLRRVGKMTFQFEDVCGPKFMTFDRM